jgi:hypothetical protein
VTTQVTPAAVKPRSRWMSGMATATMVLSSTIISDMAQSTARAPARWCTEGLMARP